MKCSKCRIKMELDRMAQTARMKQEIFVCPKCGKEKKGEEVELVSVA